MPECGTLHLTLVRSAMDTLGIRHKLKVKVAHFVSDSFATPWTTESMEFSRPEYWSRVALPFSRGSSQPRDRTQVSCVAGGFFTS